jgi:DUF917 family protein
MKLRLEDVDDLARGAAFLGTGGGGNPYLGKLLLQQVMKDGFEVEIIGVDDVPDDALVIPTAGMGAPTVTLEKLLVPEENVRALECLEDFIGRRAYATMPIEAGGTNSVVPLIVGARRGIPVIDADGMGRAFPELQMVTFSVFGVRASPMSLADIHGNSVILNARDNASAEWLARGDCIRMGGHAAVAIYPMTGAEVKKFSIPRTLTLAIEIGRTIREAKSKGRDAIAELCRYLGECDTYGDARVIFEGKIVDMQRGTTRGFAVGRAAIAGIGKFSNRMEIDFQNENLVARRDGRNIVVVPDLICILDLNTAEPITTEALRYGQSVSVVGVGAPAIMRTPDALKVFGPAAFGLDEPFEPMGR